MSAVDHSGEAGVRRPRSSLLARAGALFLEPEAAVAPRTIAAPPRPASTAAVLAAPADLPGAAGGVAARLRAATRTRTAVVCRPGDVVARPATPAASRLARRLADRDLEAVAAGALCQVALPCAPAEAVRTAWRLIGAVEVPVVLALPARLDGFDALLAELDELHLAMPAGEDDALAGLALGSLSELGPPVHRLHPPTTAFARCRAALGLATVTAPEAAVA